MAGPRAYHTFQSAVPDAGTAGEIEPSHWNADLTLVNIPGTDIANTFALAQTFTVAPIFTDQSGTRTALGLGTLATQSGTFSGTSSGTNTGDQTSIVGITGTLAQFNTAITDANIGTGDVVGPASSVDNELARYSGTTGKLLDSVAGVTLSDAGVLTHKGFIYSPGGDTSLTLSGALASPTLTANSGWSAEGVLQGLAWWTQDPSGNQYAGFGSVLGYFGVHLGSATRLGWSSAINARTANDTFIGRAGANSLYFGSGASDAAATRTEQNKAIASIADATATDVFTVTIPNASHSAMVRVTLVGKIGAGGAIGAGEATGTIAYDIAIARTAGVNAVASISAAYGSSVCAVAGATTITVAGTLGAITGAVGASNTFTIKVTITKGGGASANHTCLAYATLLNANATGITIA